MTVTTLEKRQERKRLMKSEALWIAFVLFWAFALAPIPRWYDEYWLERPFVSATVEIAKRDEDGVYIFYDADAVIPIDAKWIAMVHLAGNDIRVASRRGDGSYSDVEDDPRAWSWDAFFDQEDGVAPPTIPTEAFYICLRYIATTRDTGVTDESGPFCSNVLDPEAHQ